jgi:hypothetical protein
MTIVLLPLIRLLLLIASGDSDAACLVSACRISIHPFIHENLLDYR